MDQSSETLLLIVSITTLFTGCCGAVSDISQPNWSDVQRHCRKEGKILSNLLTHALYNESYFWTGYHTRLSKWIKIIGCFEETAVNTLTEKSYEMYFPSAGRCQEVCLASNYSVFGIQLKKCVCLEQIPGQRSRGANDCSSSCSEKYPTETNVKFQNDCGGHHTYSLFKSGSEIENSAFTTNECLSIQCAVSDKKFIEQECFTSSAQICNESLFVAYSDWQSSSSKCKSHNSYLLGDVNLTDPKKTCDLIQGTVTGPSWLGIAKELYISIDGEKDDMVRTEKNPIRCLKCNSNNCTFADCSEFNYFVCMERPTTTTTTPTGITKSTTPPGTVSTSTIPTGFTTSTNLHGTVSASTSPTGTTTSTTPHGTVSTSTSPTGITTSTTPHGTVSTSTSPTGTTTSTTPHGTVSAFTSPTGTTTRTTPHGSVSTSSSPTGTTKSTTTHGSVSTSTSPTGTIKSTTTHGSVSTSTTPTGKTTVIMIVVPVTVMITLGPIVILLVILCRRQTKKTAETKNVQHKPDLPNDSEKSDTNHSSQNNYFVLEKTETYSVVNSTNHAKGKGCRSPLNECYDDGYDHLGEIVREEEEKEDTYHHAFFTKNEDESDYGTRNKSDECLMENPYSHTNTRDYHVVLADNEYNTISIDA